jgi:tRNA pseudouridine13 synthase
MMRMLDERKFYKLRTRAEDFIIEELLGKPGRTGGFGLYLMEKKHLTTLDAVKIVAKKCDIPFRAIGFAGMKDKHALARQFITVPRKYSLKLDEPNLKLRLIGYRRKPLKLGSHRGNKFTIILRKMRPGILERLRRNALTEIPIPNYYDSQRFGSIKGSGEFPAVEIMRGNYEGALKMLMTSYYRKERSHAKKIKRFLGQHWRQWSVCRRFLEGERRYENFHEIVSYLEENPEDYQGALGLIRGSVMELVIASFQSFLWNEALKDIMHRNLGERRLYRVKYAAGHLVFHRKRAGRNTQFYEEYGEKDLELPHPGIRGPEAEIYGSLLRRKNLSIKDLKALMGRHGVPDSGRKMFFRTKKLRIRPLIKGSDREAFVSFITPPGSYGTIVLKNLLE